LLETPSLRVAILTYGGIVSSLEVPDRTGRMENVVLGLPNLAAYVRRHPYFGAIAATPVASRMAASRSTGWSTIWLATTG